MHWEVINPVPGTLEGVTDTGNCKKPMSAQILTVYKGSVCGSIFASPNATVPYSHDTSLLPEETEPQREGAKAALHPALLSVHSPGLIFPSLTVTTIL